MFIKTKNYNLRIGFMIRSFTLLILTFCIFAENGNAQTMSENIPPASDKKITGTRQNAPVWTNYRGIKIGMTADEVRDKLGKAKIDDKDGLFYQFSDEESAQINFDKDKEVQLISVTYSHKNENAPKYTDVFGSEAAAKPDGSIYNLVDYPEAGYWVAYSRMSGDKPTVTITMQKL